MIMGFANYNHHVPNMENKVLFISKIFLIVYRGLFSELLEISVNGLGRGRLINPKLMILIWVIWSAVLQKPLILRSFKFILIVSWGQVKGRVICLARSVLYQILRLLPVIPTTNNTNLFWFATVSNEVSLHIRFINNRRMEYVLSVKVSQLCNFNFLRIELIESLSWASKRSTKR